MTVEQRIADLIGLADSLGMARPEPLFMTRIVRHLQEAILEERETCAKVVEDGVVVGFSEEQEGLFCPRTVYFDDGKETLDAAAKAIRERPAP